MRDGIFDGDGNQDSESVRGLAVTATSYDDVFLLAIAASASLGRTTAARAAAWRGGSSSSGGGTQVGIAASVGVAVLKGETKATIGDGVDVNPDNTGAHAEQGILLRARRRDEPDQRHRRPGVPARTAMPASPARSTVNEVDNFVWARALGDNTLNAAGRRSPPGRPRQDRHRRGDHRGCRRGQHRLVQSPSNNSPAASPSPAPVR